MEEEKIKIICRREGGGRRVNRSGRGGRGICEGRKRRRMMRSKMERRGRRRLRPLLQMDPVASSATGDLVSVIRALKGAGMSSQLKIRPDTREAALDLPFSSFRQKAAANEVGQRRQRWASSAPAAFITARRQ